eukprot:CAMPEP_0180681766 /NCGR_PEP_ID=MMETSP1037_2-20121125/70176_1 /TAXON_ID=632150 /ORGANISM="Azadinium spinosum, Strain 3D9" /LENGTH=152 /DNA_ID=CAMNT_0022711669 /DNA_START=175 /DNA_END=633 /DNA_ORIENTATION=+
MASDLHDIEQITVRIHALQHAVNTNTWDDCLDNFLALYNLSGQIRGERSYSVLMHLFQNRRTRHCLARARQFRDIAEPDHPPDEVLRWVKTTVSSVRSSSYAVEKLLQHEKANIQRIGQYKQRASGLVVSASVGFFVALFGFVQQLILEAMT